MEKMLFTAAVILTSLSFGGVSYACDMHGAGYGGYGLRNATWQTYNPQVSTTDPAFAEKDIISPMQIPAATPTKTKPSFSNVANLAAAKAKARFAKKPDPKAKVKKTALNADR